MPDQPSLSARVERSEAMCRVLRERAAQALAAASEAAAHYSVLLEVSAQQLAAIEGTRVEVDATREMLRQSVQRYAVLMKSLDTSPERTLSLVNETVQEELSPSERSPETLAVLAEVVSLCIDAYHDTSSAA